MDYRKRCAFIQEYCSLLRELESISQYLFTLKYASFSRQTEAKLCRHRAPLSISVIDLRTVEELYWLK